MSVESRTTDRDPSSWLPGADVEALRARAAMLADLRDYFSAVGVLEVETPLAAGSGATDPAIEPLLTRYAGPGFATGYDLYLQTSPEHAMKRLLAAGSGPIYQICKAFRNGEAGRLHNPEFSLLEWYRPGMGTDELMGEVARVARIALGRPDLAVASVAYADLFEDHLAIDFWSADATALQALAVRRGILGAADMDLDLDGWRDLLLSHLIQPTLGGSELCFVTHYPATQAALARLHGDGRTAARFELFHRGVELANGYQELTDADEQSARFEADNCRRRGSRQRPVKVDSRLLQALQQGLPDCAGVAVGLDRLLMLRLGRASIDEVISFSLSRC